MTETEDRLLAICEAMATATGDTARMCVEVVEILQSALGLREGLHAPDELENPTHYLDGAPISK